MRRSILRLDKIFLSLNMSMSIEYLNLVFIRFNVEKDRSADAELIGIATAIAYTRFSVGYASFNM